MKALVVLAGFLCFLGLPGTAFGQAFREGIEFQANTYSTASQSGPDIVADAAGNVLVVWSSRGSSGSDSSSFSIQGQRYDATGIPQGAEFQINTYTTAQQSRARVAVDATGGFVVVWDSDGSSGTDSSSFSVQARRYDNTGAPLGSDFQLNTYITGAQHTPAVATDPSGGFVAVWSSVGSAGTDSSESSIQARRYDASGVPQGLELQVNSYTTSYQSFAEVAVDAAGGFVVVWQSLGSSGSDSFLYSVQGQRYDNTGAPLGTEFQVNTSTVADQISPAVAALAGGGFVVVWSSYDSSGSDTDPRSIQGQRYDNSGAPLGTEFQVNTHTTSTQRFPDVAADGSGGFLAVWDHGYSLIRGRRFDGTGAPVGGEFAANTRSSNVLRDPRATHGPGGGFTVAWTSYAGPGPDLDSNSVRGQRYTTAGLCGAAPEPDGACRLADPVGAGKSSILIKDKTPDAKDQLKWKWKRGEATETADFKSPDTGVDVYRFCLYDAGGKLHEIELMPGGAIPDCQGQPCWKATGTKGFRHKDKLGLPTGVTGAKLQEGAAGRSQVQIKVQGKSGFYFAPATAGLVLPVTAQLLIDDGSTTECFKTTFTTFSKQDATKFKAKGP